MHVSGLLFWAEICFLIWAAELREHVPCHISTGSHTQLLHFLRMKASVIWKNACKVFLTQDILAGADQSQIWFLPSACQLSARDRQHCEQGETVGTEGLDGTSVNSLSCLLSQAQNTQHRALLVARDHREMSAPNSKAKDPTGGMEGGRPPPRPRGQGLHLRGTCTHTGTVLSSSRMPCPFHCWAEWSSSVQTPTICGPGRDAMCFMAIPPRCPATQALSGTSQVGGI